jgi:putative CocE/NonD family hydrolase
MTTTVPVPSVRSVPERPLPRMVALMARQSRRGLPPPRCAVRVAAGIEVPGADGVILRTDHYVPQLAGPLPALLVRSPYGRGFPWNFLYGALFAEQGFHVILQGCRGTGGSTGRLEPFRHEQADGLATVAWLRQQDWFTGSLATIGASYLGYVQLALAADPPPELRAMIVQNCVTGPYPVMYPGGAFALENILIATTCMANFDRGLGAIIRAMLRMQRRLGRVTRALPLVDAYVPALGGRLGYFEEWLANPDPGSEYWRTLDVTADSPVPAVPVSLLTGWYDICLDGTLADYARLRAAGTPARLTVGPWTHTSGFNDDMPIVAGEALRWLHAHLAENPGTLTEPPVRLYVGGSGEWRDLADWPPPGMMPQPWYAAPGGALSADPPATAGTAGFRYDPADPTPSAGGQLLSTKAGPADDRRLESRADVLVFTSAPLGADLEVIGPVSARFRVHASHPHLDLFARLCDVDERGRSTSVCDGLQRHQPGDGGASDQGPGGAAPGDQGPDDAAPGGDGPSGDGPGGDGPGELVITVGMSATAYRFRAGHRIRLTVSGGAHPRFARNTGSGEPPATATRLVPADIQIRLGGTDPAMLSLPVVPPAG